MGLGVLFIGYVLISVFTYAPTFFITDLIGAFVMHEALVKLERHAKRFKYAIYSVYALFVVATVQCVYYALHYVGIIESLSDTVNTVIEVCRLVTVLVYTVTMLLSLEELSRSVGDNKLGDRCRRNMWYYVISFAMSLSLSFDLDILKDYVSAFSAFAFLLKLLCSFLVPAVIYSCYMWICLSGDHDMDKKESKLQGFFSKIKSGDKDDVTKEDLKKLKDEKKASKKK